MNDGYSGRYGSEGPGPDDGQDSHGPQQHYYDPYAQQPRRQPPYDPYAPQQQYYDQYGQPYYDPYAPQQPPQTPSPPQMPPQTPRPPQPPRPPQMPQARQMPQAPQQTGEQQWIPQQPSYDTYPQHPGQAPPQVSRQPPRGGPGAGQEPGREPELQRTPADYRTEQFSFVEDPDEDADDVIDWLKFAETRSERRDERKRKGRNRVTALVVVLVLALVGGVGYLWYAGRLPGLAASADPGEAASGPQKRDVIVVHLRDTKGGGSASALLVDNKSTGKGTTVLLPNSLAVPAEDGTRRTLGESVEDGTGPTRDALNTLLGADIKGSWRLDTPYLEILVETVGGITVDTDATVPGAKQGDDPLVRKGTAQSLGGQAAVGYATYRAPGEQQTKQLRRFGQVMEAVLKKLPSDDAAATTTVQTLNQIPDPSLTEQQLGASLAQLAEQAKTGSYTTALLPVQPDGTLSEQATESVVREVLGGAVANTGTDAAPRISVKNATGSKDATSAAQITLVNGGYTVVDGGTAEPAQAVSRVVYADPDRAADAGEVAKTLGLPASAVQQGKGAANADVTVMLGQDYRTG